jgi:hypothetical protein
MIIMLRDGTFDPIIATAATAKFGPCPIIDALDPQALNQQYGVMPIPS